MKVNIYFLRAVIVALSLFFSIQCTYASGLPKQNAFWGMMVGDAKGQGIAVTAIRDKSPAGACLQTGDIIVSINGMSVRSTQEFNAVKNNFPLYIPLNLTVKRNGTIMQCQILLEGRKPLEVKSIKSEFVIPGVPPIPLTVPSAIEALDQVNVLDQIILEPKTGEIAIIGHYDARYNTGSIPYLDLLKTAIAYPKPKLNLVQSQETKQMIQSDKNKLWDWDAKDFILGHPDLEQERQLLIQVWALACGLSPNELVTLYNYVYFGDKQVFPPLEIKTIQSKILNNLGYADAAQAYDLVNQTGPDTTIKALQILGQTAEGRMILARNGGDATKGQGMLAAAVYLAIMEKIYAPAGMVDLLRDNLDQGRTTWQEVVKQAQGYLLPVRSSTDKREIVNAALNKIQLTEQGTRAIQRSPLEGKVYLESIDVEANSQLNRILYEADYSLKSVKVMPQLFWNIPGSMSEQEYEISKGFLTTQIGARTTDFWFEPKFVSIIVSPDRRIVNFGAAEMSYKSLTYFSNPKDAKNQGDISHNYDNWCAGVMDNYDEYARILPAFHKVRETAKIIALANWLINEKVPVNLSGTMQEKWDAPRQVLGYWRASFVYFENNGSYDLYRTDGASYTGGVTFQNKGNWTQISAGSPQSETKVADQLVLSTGLGQKAVEAAKLGNLEQASYLAELSAQAMTGSLSKTDLLKLNIPVPDAKLSAVAPANVQLQKEMIKKTYQQITALSHGTVSKEAAADDLGKLGTLYNQILDNPRAASDYLIKLQTGQLPVPTTKPENKPVIDAKDQTKIRCVGGNLGKQDMTPERREYLRKRLQETRDNLKYIDEALRRIAELNAKDVKQLEELTQEISKAYAKAWDRVAELAVDVMLDDSLWKDKKAFEKSTKQYEEDLQYINNNISYWIGKKTTALDAQTMKTVDNELKSLYANKYLLQETYNNGKKLHEWGQAGGKGILYGKDIAEVAQEKDFMERAKQGFINGVGIALDLPGAEKVWKGIKLLGRVQIETAAGWWNYGQYIVNYAGDIACQRYGWEPLVDQLTKNLDSNRQAVIELRKKAAESRAEVECLEGLLQ